MKPVRPIDCLFATPRTSPRLEEANISPALPGLSCPANVAGILKDMDRYGIERVLLKPCQVACDRQYLCGDGVLGDLEYTLWAHPDRFSALTEYNADDIRGSLVALEEAVGKQACRGLYISTKSALLLTRRIYPAYAKCLELNVPVMIHADDEFTSTRHWPMLEDVRTIAADFPELKVVAACGRWPAVSDMRRLLERCENVSFAVDANPRCDLVPAISDFLNSDFGRSRCLWGSNGWAWETALEQLDRLPLSENARSRFVRENAVSIFALDCRQRPQHEDELILTGE